MQRQVTDMYLNPRFAMNRVIKVTDVYCPNSNAHYSDDLHISHNTYHTASVQWQYMDGVNSTGLDWVVFYVPANTV